MKKIILGIFIILLALSVVSCKDFWHPDGNDESNPTPTPTPTPTYNIGDTGPAGGLIFYDNGSSSDDWRYLEAAPVNTETYALWGAMNIDVIGTSAGIGTGKRNTQAIISSLQNIGESGVAAQQCDALVKGGYGDWFLPSKDELNLMYQNLRTQGLGGFSDHLYWSSSQYDSSAAWLQHFNTSDYGNQEFDEKRFSYAVRAVRAF